MIIGIGNDMGLDENSVHYIAFKPSQIKSAIGNRGTFDQKEKDITIRRLDVDAPRVVIRHGGDDAGALAHADGQEGQGVHALVHRVGGLCVCVRVCERVCVRVCVCVCV